MSESIEPAKELFWENREKEKDIQNKAQYFQDEYRGCYYSNEKDRNLFRASQNLYIGVENKQWDGAAVSKLQSERRPVNTFNVTKINIDKVFGQITLNPNEMKFAAINQEDVSKVNIVDSLFEYDVERGNWKKEMNTFTKDVLNHTGVLEMYVDYRHSKLGNISIRALNRADDIEFDGYWNSDNIEDARYIFKTYWNTARQLKDTFDTKSEEIDQSINQYEHVQGMEDFAEKREEMADRSPFYWESTTSENRYKVLEVSYMQRVPTDKKKYDKKIDEFLEKNAKPGVTRQQAETLMGPPDYEDICKIMTIAPGVNKGLILQEGNHPVQIGRLPYFVASSDNTMGVRQGLTTGCIDAQVSLNKTMSLQTGNQISSTNGALLVNEDLFKDDAEYQKFTQDRNKPGSVFRTESGADLRKDIAVVPTGQMPEGLQASIDWRKMFIEMYTNSTDAVSGRSGGANESGVLFESKKNQAQVAHVGLSEVLSSIDNQLAEAYFYLGKVVYSGPHREMRSSKTGEKIDINKRVAMDDLESAKAKMPNASVNIVLADGKGTPMFAILNEIASLPRHTVIIKKSDFGLDQKQHSLSVYSEMSQRSVNPVEKAVYSKLMIPFLPIPPDGVKELTDAADIFIALQIAQVKSQINTMNAQNAQSEVVVAQSQQQLGQGQQPQSGQPGEEQPQEVPGDARTAANGAGQGNLGQGIAQDSSGANNQAGSDV